MEMVSCVFKNSLKSKKPSLKGDPVTHMRIIFKQYSSMEAHETTRMKNTLMTWQTALSGSICFTLYLHVLPKMQL